jgi:predicted RND superfamily exporter protein
VLEYLLKKAARLSAQHPTRILITFLLVLVLSFLATGRLRFEADWLRLLPSDRGALKVLVEDLQDFSRLERLYILVEGEDQSKLIEAAHGLRGSLTELEIGGDKAFKEVSSGMRMDMERWEKVLSLYLSSPQLFLQGETVEEFKEHLSDVKIQSQVRQAKALLTSSLASGWRGIILVDPLSMREILFTRLQGGSPWTPSLSEGHLLSSDGKALLMVADPSFASADIRSTQALVRKLEDIKGSFPTLRISFVGPHTMTVGKAGVMQQDLLISFLSSLAIVLALFYLAYRRWATLLFVGFPLLVGVQITLGAAALFIGGLNLITVAFAAIIVGLGVDFAIHIYQRYHHERAGGRGAEKAVEIALTRTGTGVWTGGLTTIAAFLTLLLARIQGIVELGILVAAGLFFCLLTITLVLPAFLVWTERRGYRYTPLRTWGLDHLTAFLKKHYRLVLICLIALAVIGGYVGTKVRMVAGLEGFRPRGMEGMKPLERMQEQFGGQGTGMTVLLKGVELNHLLKEQEAIASALRDQYSDGILFVTHLAQFIPSLEQQSRVLVELREGMDYGKAARSFNKALEQEGLNPQAFSSTGEMLRGLASQEAPIPPKAILQDLTRTPLAEVVERYVKQDGDGYRLRQEIRFDQATVDPLQLEKKIKEIAPEAECTSNELIALQLRGMVKRDFTLLAPLALAVVLVLLFLHFRNPRWVGMALTPLLAGVAYMLGASVLLGIELNPANAVAVPLILGIGIDDGIHIVHRYRERKDVGQAVKLTGRAVIMTSLTTMVGFGSLSTSHFPALASMGHIALLGIGSCLLTSMLLLPSLLWAISTKEKKEQKNKTAQK